MTHDKLLETKQRILNKHNILGNSNKRALSEYIKYLEEEVILLSKDNKRLLNKIDNFKFNIAYTLDKFRADEMIGTQAEGLFNG